MAGTMTIAEVGRKYGVTQDTLRYYERVGAIPPVSRSPGGIREYSQEDCGWVELAVCMRSAGLPVEVMAEYLRLALLGDSTIAERRELLLAQRGRLLEQREAIDSTLSRLDYKISRYDEAVKTGVLSWD